MVGFSKAMPRRTSPRIATRTREYLWYETTRERQTSLHVDRRTETGNAERNDSVSCPPESVGSTAAGPGTRPRRVVVPGCKRDAKPDTSRVVAGNRSKGLASTGQADLAGSVTSGSVTQRDVIVRPGEFCT